MDEAVMSRGQRREARRNKETDEKPLTQDRFLTKARAAGLVVMRNEIEVVTDGKITKVIAAPFELKRKPCVQLRWRDPETSKPLYVNVFTLGFCQSVIRTFGDGKFPQPENA